MKLKAIYIEPLLGLLLLTDLGFLAGHIMASFMLVPNEMFFVDRDRSYPELFQYIKFLWIVLILVYLGLKKSRAYLAWSSFFAFLLLDDCLELHETGGSRIAEQLGFKSLLALRSVDYGEMTYALFIALFFFVVIALTYRRSLAEFKRFSQRIMLLVALLAFFAVGVDMAHIMVISLPYPFGFLLEKFLAIVEDGGEMMVLSIITCYAFTKVQKANYKRQKYDIDNLKPSHLKL